MDFQHVIDHRKMVRSFQDKAIEDTKLEQIISNMLSGPSAGFSQGTELVILQDKVSKDLFFEQWGSVEERQAYQSSWPNLENAPIIILVCADETQYQKRYAEPDKSSHEGFIMPWWLIDAGMASLLGLLSAVDQELVATFTGIRSQNYMRKHFAIPDHILTVGAVLLGYQQGEYRPSKSVSRGRRDSNEIVHYDHW